MSQPRPAEELRAGRVVGERLGKCRTHLVPRRAAVQSDKIDDNAAPRIAQPDLTRDGRDGGKVSRKPGALRRPRFRCSRIHVDHHPGSRRLKMDGPAAREGERIGQRLLKHRVEVDQPLGFRVVHDGAARQGGADFGNGRGVVHDDFGGRPRQRSR